MHDSDVRTDLEDSGVCFDSSDEHISVSLKDISKSLKNKVFSGYYKDRKLIESGSMIMYKDVIEINKSELNFKKTLQSTNELLRKQFGNGVNTCITGPTVAPSVWTNLSGVAFGHHFFILKGLTIEKNIVHFRIKWIRSVNEEKLSSSSAAAAVDFINWDWFVFNLDSFKRKLRKLYEIITLENIKYVFQVLLVVILCIISAIHELLLLSLKLVHEFNYFFRTLQPMFIACIHGMTKAWGGLLLLLTMLWRNSGQQKYQNRAFHFATPATTHRYLTSTNSYKYRSNFRYRPENSFNQSYKTSNS